MAAMLSAQMLVSLVILSCIAADDPMVEIKCGKLTGKAVDFSHKDVNVKRTLHVFKGIPYAEPPVDDLRFRPPQPKVPWDGVYDATNVGFACKQPPQPLIPLEEPLSENCLFLNIYAPQTDSGPLPVMVWIHGGGLSTGSGTQDDMYDATALAAIGDVIVVSFNYRLGVFGFFYTGDEHAPGNYGFLDQVAALKWVQENIQAFGGDTGRVTIFGESAGSTSVDLLLLSPLTDGLFHRAIMQSGTATMAMDFVVRGPETQQNKIAHGLGKLVGCERDTSEELVQCLRTVPAGDIEEALDPAKNLLATTLPDVDPDLTMYPFPPALDGNFITAMPSDVLKEGSFAKTDVAIMIGTNADEGTLYLAMMFPDKVNETEIFMDKTMYEQLYAAFLFGPPKHSPMAQEAIKLMYVNWAEADSDNANYFDSLSQMQGDFMYVCPSDLSARGYVKAGANVYMYHLTHTPATSVWPVKFMKVSHGEDLQFVFGDHFGQRNWTMPEEEVTMSLNVIKYWTNFAKTGNPNQSGDKEDPSLADWPLFKVPGLEYKELSPKMETKRALKARECAFWNDFLPKLLKHTDVDTVCAGPDDETKKYSKEGNQP